MARITVRNVANDKEREALFAFRYRVYVSELAMTGEADHERRWLRDDYDECCTNYAVFENDQVVGSLRIIRMSEVDDLDPFIEKFSMAPALSEIGPDAIATSSRFMIADHLRNTMAIYHLMRRSWQDSNAKGIRLNFGDCSPHLLPFYERLGFRRYVDGYNDTAFGFKLPLLMILCDNDLMRRVRSPFAAMIADESDDRQARDWFAKTYPDYKTLNSASFLSAEIFFDLLAQRLAGDPLHAMALLRGLDQSEAALFLKKATVIKVKPGHRIIREGEREKTIYAMLSGVAEVRSKDKKRLPLAILGAGDTFGEIGFLTSSNRTADIIARTDGEVLVLSSDFLELFLRDEASIAAKVLLNLANELAGRLAVTTEQIKAAASNV